MADAAHTDWAGQRVLLFLDDPTCRWLWMTGFKEFEDLAVLAPRLLREGDTVFDIGAYYGYVATVFSAAVDSTGRVLAVEAAPHTAARALYTLELLLGALAP